MLHELVLFWFFRKLRRLTAIIAAPQPISCCCGDNGLRLNEWINVTSALSITVLRVPRVACPPVMFTCTNTAGQVRHGESARVRTSSGTQLER